VPDPSIESRPATLRDWSILVSSYPELLAYFSSLSALDPAALEKLSPSKAIP
jgi:hypothetical protein